jgi:hypothetical protein
MKHKMKATTIRDITLKTVQKNAYNE